MDLPDKSLYSGFINFFIIGGKKSLAKKIIDQVFLLINKKVKASSSLIYFLFLTKLNVLVEARKVISRRKSFFVPFPLNSKRSVFMALSWLKKGASFNKRKVSLSFKLAFEILRVIKSRPCTVLNLKKENFNKISLNKSFLYFRW